MARAQRPSALCLILLLAVAGCVYDLDEHERPCGKEGECRGGLVCRGGRCVPGEPDKGQEAGKDGATDSKGPDVVDLKTDQQSPDQAVDLPAPDQAKPDQAKPDMVSADLPLPDQTATDLLKADLLKADLPKPDLALPDLALPDVALPDMPLPDMSLPDKALPDMALPDMALPDKAKPDQSPPDILTCDSLLCCGDNKISSMEQCDGKNLGDKTCVNVKQGYLGGQLECNPVTCTFDYSGCHKCGNKTIDSGEDCDGALLGKKTCKTYKYLGGKIACKNCKHDKSGCFKVVGSPVNMTQGQAGDQTEPDIACTTGSCLVVWESSGKIRGWLVDKGGNRIGKELAISTTSGPHHVPSVALDGTFYFVVWEDHSVSTKPSIRGAKLTTSGTPWYKNLPIASAATASKVGLYAPDVACNAADCLVAWRIGKKTDVTGIYRSIQGVLVQKNGLPKSGTVQHYSAQTTYYKNGFSAPSVASDGKAFMVVWAYTTKTNAYLKSHGVDKSGALVNATEQTLLTSSAYYGAIPGSVAWDGALYLVPYADGKSINTLRLDAKGVNKQQKLHVATVGTLGLRRPAATMAKGASLIVWVVDQNTGIYNGLHGVLVKGGVAASEKIWPVQKNKLKDRVGVAHDGDQSVAVYCGGGTGQDVYVQRIKND